jgi:hypothetical protein
VVAVVLVVLMLCQLLLAQVELAAVEMVVIHKQELMVLPTLAVAEVVAASKVLQVIQVVLAVQV